MHTVARVEILSSSGQIETLEGTTIHPIWSEDRQDWVPLGELNPGEQLRCGQGSGQTSPFELQTSTVLSLIILNQTSAVYNIEVHGEHVYQVGELGLLVHNACPHVDGGIATGQQALDGAISFLKAGYREMGRGRFLSADKLRQVRLGPHEMNPKNLHIHFEHFDIPGGNIIESTFTKIIAGT